MRDCEYRVRGWIWGGGGGGGGGGRGIITYEMRNISEASAYHMTLEDGPVAKK